MRPAITLPETISRDYRINVKNKLTKKTEIDGLRLNTPDEETAVRAAKNSLPEKYWDKENYQVTLEKVVVKVIE